MMEIKGKRVYSKLKYESGVHRVQRVPQTEAQGRVHTSTATVAIMPEVNVSLCIYTLVCARAQRVLICVGHTHTHTHTINAHNYFGLISVLINI